MMKYKWNKKEINEQIKKLKKLKPDKDSGLGSELKLLHDMKMIRNNINPDLDLSKLSLLFTSNKKIINNFKDDFENYITDYQNKVLVNSEDVLCSGDYQEMYQSSLEIPISFIEQKELIYKYLSEGALKKYHKDLFNINYGILQTTPYKDLNYTFSLSNKTYVSIYNSETVESFKNLCHELGHYDEDFFSNSRLTKLSCDEKLFKYNTFTEIFSIFYELLSIDILEKEKIITPNDAVCLHLNSIEYKLFDAEYYKFAKYCVSEGKVPIKDRLYMASEFQSPFSIVTYYYSFLVACRLYMQYKEDPEKAMYSVRYIVNNITPENEEKLLKMVDANPEDFAKINEYTKRLKTKN